MQRLIIVYNPRSSKYKLVKKDILDKTTSLKGYMVGKYAVEKTFFEDNVKKLGKLLKADDLVLAVGGDATAAIAANAILTSKKDAILSVLPYGNFNDLASTLKTKTLEDTLSGKVKKLYPLQIFVDQKFWRYATCYVTIGMTAEAVELFDEPKVRKNLQKAHKSSWRSYVALAKWYFKNRHKKVFLPEFTINGKETAKKVSDYAAVNGLRMCRVMKGGEDYLRPTVFRSENCRLTNFWRLFKLMTKSILVRTPGTETVGDTLVFKDKATVEFQAEGEYQVFKDIETIEVKKDKTCLRVIQN